LSKKKLTAAVLDRFCPELPRAVDLLGASVLGLADGEVARYEFEPHRPWWATSLGVDATIPKIPKQKSAPDFWWDWVPDIASMGWFEAHVAAAPQLGKPQVLEEPLARGV
jgi:hypothetical protein